MAARQCRAAPGSLLAATRLAWGISAWARLPSPAVAAGLHRRLSSSSSSSSSSSPPRVITIDRSGLLGTRPAPVQSSPHPIPAASPATPSSQSPPSVRVPRSRETPLVPFLRSLILARGPMTVADFMRHALGHPTYGYYCREGAAVFGTKGDFTTSPEISQMFGELVAVWIVASWQGLVGSGAMREDQTFGIVECGPGKGTLAVDALRTLSRFRAVRERLSGVHLVETSGPLRRVQARALRCEGPGVVEEGGEARGRAGEGQNSAGGAPPFMLESATLSSSSSIPGLRVSWHSALEDVPRGQPLFLVAQELFDALPVHQLVWAGDRHGWRERLVDVEPDDEAGAAAAVAAAAGGGMGQAAVPAGTDSAVPAPQSPSQSQSPGPAAPSTWRRHHFRMVRAPGPTPASLAYTAAELVAAAANEAEDSDAGAPSTTAPAPASSPTSSPIPPVVRHTEGDVAEYSPASIKLAHHMATRIGEDGGAALIVDYGSSSSSVWSLRGIQRHSFVDPFLEPGDVDLSVDVDFGTLARAAKETGVADAHGPVTQGEFLQRMGIAARLQKLLESAKGERRVEERGEEGNGRGTGRGGCQWEVQQLRVCTQS
jgi:NADH dehydrogenase [ubiquinone] 1 alpha subcomplex assembly factor 7